MLLQSKKIDELTNLLEESKSILNNPNINVSDIGIFALASLLVSSIFNDIDKASKIYIDSIKNLNEEKEIKILKKKQEYLNKEIDKYIKKNKKEKSINAKHKKFNSKDSKREKVK